MTKHGINEEIRMINDERNPNDEIRNGPEVMAHAFVIRALLFLRHSYR